MIDRGVNFRVGRRGDQYTVEARNVRWGHTRITTREAQVTVHFLLWQLLFWWQR